MHSFGSGFWWAVGVLLVRLEAGKTGTQISFAPKSRMSRGTGRYKSSDGSQSEPFAVMIWIAPIFGIRGSSLEPSEGDLAWRGKSEAAKFARSVLIAE